ncbi:MAG TPA: CHRD domain-containing protein [Planctomycetota bacterium]|nr:CHRD domain-containing protein [Planctomycetota bacterium]
MLVAFPATLAAQVNFGARLNGASEVPANASVAIGRSWFTLDPVTSQIHYRVESNVVGGTVAHIHQGAVGVPGPIIFPLAGGPTIYQGSTPPLTGAQIQTLFGQGFYVNVHTAAFPAGEIRGQMTLEVRRHFFATLDQAQETPPSGSAGTATAELVLHQPENIVTYRMSDAGLTGPPLAAHMHQAPPGVPGPIIFGMNNLGDFWCGSSDPLTPAQVTTLLAGGMYVNIHTAAFPGGEIRGQITPLKERFVARENGAEETPPSGSPFTGTMNATFDPATNMISYSQTWNGVGGTVSHIHSGVPGIAGPILFPLAGPPNGPWAGTTAALTPAQVNMLFAGTLYANIHSGAFPAGEIRAQLLQNSSTYGWPNPTSFGVLANLVRIGDTGPPILGGIWTTRVTDAAPTTFVGLAVGGYLMLDLGFLGCTGGVLWVSPDNAFSSASDPLGCGEVSIPVPLIPGFAGLPIGSQWITIDFGANPLGITVSAAQWSTFQ